MQSALYIREFLLKAWLVVAVGLVGAGLLVQPGDAEAQGGHPAKVESAAYDIPAQDLDAALGLYMQASGAQVFYESSLTSGRRSAPVKGRLMPEPALRVLLTDTGLVARRIKDDAFSVVVATAKDADAPAAPIARGSQFRAALQASVLKALCRNPKTRPGNYRIVLELWIGARGNVQSSALTGTTGDPARDAAVIAALQDVEIGVSAPAGMPQPVLLTIAPQPPPETGDCAG